MPPEALWNGAAAIVGGTIHDLRDPYGPYFVATLRVGVLYRGSLSSESTTVRIYGPAEKEGRSAIWFFRGSPDGVLSEEYPWIRAGPAQFLIWPHGERERVLARLPHAYSEKVQGLQLLVIRAPAGRADPLSVWLVLLTVPNAAPDDANRIPAAATLRVERPDGRVTESSVDVPRVPAGLSAERGVRVLRGAGEDLPDQIAVAAPPLSGVYRITLVAPLDARDREALTATLVVEY